MPPNVTISPWAKLVRPVVPKISDRPTEHMAMTSPSRMPSARRWANFSKPLWSPLWDSPVKNVMFVVDVMNDAGVIVSSAVDSPVRSRSSGSVDSSRRTT